MYVLIQTNDESGAQFETPRRSEHRTVLGAKRAAITKGHARARIEQDGRSVWRFTGQYETGKPGRWLDCALFGT